MQGQAPHAIVLDLMMPLLDGRGFVELKRLNPHFAAIPILMVTAAYGAFDAAARLGGDACLTKPFELDELVSAVDRLVGAGQPDRAAAPTGSIDRSTLAQA